MRKRGTVLWTPGGLARAVLLVAGWSVAPAAAQQADPVGGAADGPAGTTAFQVLLESRAQLALTPEQVEEIDRIRARLREANLEPLTGMMELRSRWQRQQLELAVAQRRAGRAAPAPRPAENAALQRIRRAAQPLNQQIQANTRAAMREVRRLLTPDQRERLRALIEARRGPAPAGAAAASGGGGVGG